jgi:hypothetical protein
MSNETGRGSRSNEPPPLATVSRLSIDENTPRSGADEADWYETERLTGQITGGGRSAAAADEPAIAPERTPVLDWRHADPSPIPSAAQRLRRSLARRRRPNVTLRVPWPDGPLRRHRQTAATSVPEGETPVSPTSTTPPTAAHPTDPARLLLGFRHDPEHPKPKARRPLRARARKPRLVSGRHARIVPLAIVSTVAATIAIAVALSASPTRPRRAPDAAASLRQAPDLTPDLRTAKALTAAIWFVEHHVRGSARAHRSVRARRARPATHRRAYGATHHPSSSQSVAPPAAPSSVSTASSSGSASSSPSYSGSSSVTSTSSQSVTSEPAPAASAQHTQSTQPAFGQNGSLGPGRGAPGTQ